MSELQDTLHRLEAWGGAQDGLTVQVILDIGIAVEAARLVADLDFEAAAAEYLFATDPVPPRTWDMLSFVQQQTKLTIARAIVNTALGITKEDR